MNSKFLLSFLLYFLIVCVHAQTTYQNPIITGMNPDPSICRVGDDYYIVTSTFEYFPGLPIYHSKDLVNWNMIGYVLTTPTQLPLVGCEASTGGLYAPTIRYYDSTFYVVCTNYGGKGSQGSFYVTSKNILGPWSEPHWVESWACDPSLLFANDSVYYTFPGDNGVFMQTTLNLKTGKFNNAPRVIASGQGGSSPEGPHLYKIKDYYYLMSAEGGTGYEHREVIQRSKSPWGPFEVNPLNPIITHMNSPSNPFHAIGHADLVETPDGWWLVCLGIRPIDRYHHLGRETFMAPVKWTSDGWPRIGQGIIKEQYNSPNLPRNVWSKESSIDNFDSTQLSLAWNFIRNPHSEDWSLTETPGFLRLHGSAISFKEKDSPAFICRRQTAFNIDVTTKMNFIPTSDNEEAGLVVRGNDINHYDLIVTNKDGKRVVILRKCLKDKDTTITVKEISSDTIILKVTATELEYKFWFQEDGKAEVLIDSAEAYVISTEKIWGFTGTYIGMYASGNGQVNTNPADFDWFEFKENKVENKK